MTRGVCNPQGATDRGSSPPTPDEVRLWLEWAGAKILSIHVPNVRPESYRSFWPDYPDDKFTAYGYSGISLRPGAPSSYEIELMDEILNLVLLIPVVLQRRIVNCRALVSPVNNRYLYSWSKIAVLLHCNRGTVKALHLKGLETIAGGLDAPSVDRIRNFCPRSHSPLTTSTVSAYPSGHTRAKCPE